MKPENGWGITLGPEKGANGRMTMPALLLIMLTASHLAVAANTIPKFDIEKTCRPASSAAVLPGRDSSACQRDENDARTKLEQDWTKYTATQRSDCASFAGLDRAPSYVELLTCLEMAKQASELPPESKAGGVTTGSGGTGPR